MRKSGASAAHMSGLGGFVEYLESDSQVRSRFQNAFAELLSEMDCVPLFSEAGIPSDHSFTSEIGHRLSARVLPSAREESDAAKLLVILYPTQKSVQHFLDSSPELFQRLLLVVAPPDGEQFAARERSDLQEALRLNEPLATAYYLKEELYEIWEQEDQETAQSLLMDWITFAESTGIRMLHDFAKTLRFHAWGILAYYDHPISTGPLEATNNKIKTMKRQAYGFRDQEFFRLKILGIHESKYALVG